MSETSIKQIHQTAFGRPLLTTMYSVPNAALPLLLVRISHYVTLARRPFDNSSDTHLEAFTGDLTVMIHFLSANLLTLRRELSG